LYAQPYKNPVLSVHEQYSGTYAKFNTKKIILASKTITRYFVGSLRVIIQSKSMESQP
jgi:hypothetical protein